MSACPPVLTANEGTQNWAVINARWKVRLKTFLSGVHGPPGKVGQGRAEHLARARPHPLARPRPLSAVQLLHTKTTGDAALQEPAAQGNHLPKLPAPTPASSEQLLRIKKEMLLSCQTERGREPKSNSFVLYGKRRRAKSPP